MKLKMPKRELTIELVPKPCWYSNMRNAMSRAKWDSIRRSVYGEYRHRCGVCEAEGRLECHEIWQYDDTNHIQRLAGFIALCSMCHHVKHIGLAGILAEEGKLDYELVVTHFQHVNGCDRATFERHLDHAWKQWHERNRYSWITDLGPYGDMVHSHMSTTSSTGPLMPVETLRRQSDSIESSTASIDEAKLDDESRPSTYSIAYWLYAERQTGGYPDHTDRGGKWMVFVRVADVDVVWSVIKRAVEEGKLGGSAKVATALPNPNARNPCERVICVYTYDAEDYEDVTRVRQALRKLGFHSKMPYKSDQATRSRKYSTENGERVSMYFE